MYKMLLKIDGKYKPAGRNLKPATRKNPPVLRPVEWFETLGFRTIEDSEAMYARCDDLELLAIPDTPQNDVELSELKAALKEVPF